MNVRESRYTANANALIEEAEMFTKGLGVSDTATLVTLSGDLGAGKTTFTQGVAKALNVTDSVTSPTFVLQKVYALSAGSGPFERLVHIDAYRLRDGNDLAALGFDELMQDPHNLILLEWPEQVQSGLPRASARIQLTVTGEGRTITYV